VVIMMGRKRKQARLKDRFFRRFVLDAFGFKREVNHHDGVLLHNADQKNDAYQSDHSKIVARQKKARMAPTPAEGSVERIVTGWM